MAEIVKADCQNEDPIMILEGRLRGTAEIYAICGKPDPEDDAEEADSGQRMRRDAALMSEAAETIARLRDALTKANSYIDSIPIMPGNSYKDIKAVIRAALECDIHKDQAS